ncbi:uncharacterized protein LOC122089446 isoform X2 [Macadamia integrifolia]|uniref:uncharacterized protein LOC122089446 isoform X2 n=1 Tax=Macadamia integrifolia TaxID=60698 RepID=UPI001C4E45E5|nr:uncharacterized protein LOC122089446 isoform X2 [Macadamia integrifolia]
MAFSSQVQVRPFGVPPDPQAHAVHVMRPSRNLVQDRWVLRLLAQSRAFLPPFTQRGRDDTIVMIHDRKVRLLDGASPYAPCRSWVRNGLPQETQDADSVEPVSPQKLLQRHIKHANRVRARTATMDCTIQTAACSSPSSTSWAAQK